MVKVAETLKALHRRASKGSKPDDFRQIRIMTEEVWKEVFGEPLRKKPEELPVK